MPDSPVLHVWRHPRPSGAVGRCIGRTDLPVDPRKAKRLARRIQSFARLHGLPRRVLTSPLRRTADVGRWLRRWGWRHERAAALAEMDFGAWDGRCWADVPRNEIDAWCVDFLRGRPGDGESVDAFFDRVAGSVGDSDASIVVGHAGWMLALQWLATDAPRPTRADQWPAAPAPAAYRCIASPTVADPWSTA